jgi:glyoxylase-like metal-dependent hydrolase (beta-lactamase superfamily II)
MPEFERGRFPIRWTPERADCDGVPPFSVHAYNSTFFILRQSGCTHFEKPFLYLALGEREAMLIDTGAGNADAAPFVTAILREDAARAGRGPLPLLVVHSHGHSDHVAGDASFRDFPGVRFVEGAEQAVIDFFRLPDWPRGTAEYDLGERILDVFPIPGHGPASLAFYDRRTGILLTGDVVYPGRLYVRDDEALRESIDRLVAFTATRDVAHVLGCHIENSSMPFLDYPEGTTHQPDEHVLELGRAHLLELQAALAEMTGPVVRRALRDLTIWPVRGA